MAYDKDLADRVRRILTRRAAAEERAMFGGLAFMVQGHMCCGLVSDRLMVRVRPEAYEQLLKEPGAEPMDFTGKPMRGFLYVTRAGTASTSSLGTWVSRALDFVGGLPPKSPRQAASNPSRRPARPARPASRPRRAAKKPVKASRS